MTPDYVVKNLEGLLATGIIDDNERFALETAISLLQDYQKLRGRVSVENISQVIKESEKQWRREHTIDTEENIAEKIEVELSEEYLKYQSDKIITYIGRK